MPAFTYQRDLDHPVTAEVEQAIRAAVEPLLFSQGLDRIQVIPGLDHDGDPVLYVELHFKLVEPGVDPKLQIQYRHPCQPAGAGQRGVGREPRQADLRRAVSTASYDLFNPLSDTAAVCLVGATLAPVQRVPRAKQAKQVCAENRNAALELAGDGWLIWMPPVHTADGSRSPAAL